MLLLSRTVLLVWPWESVRNKLRDALTELCVASDVLTIASKVTREDKKGDKRPTSNNRKSGRDIRLDTGYSKRLDIRLIHGFYTTNAFSILECEFFYVLIAVSFPGVIFFYFISTTL